MKLLITRLAVQVRPGEPESTRPYSESCRALSVFWGDAALRSLRFILTRRTIWDSLARDLGHP